MSECLSIGTCQPAITRASNATIRVNEMSWNYRVIRKRHTRTDTVTYQIREVYYDEDREIE